MIKLTEHNSVTQSS